MRFIEKLQAAQEQRDSWLCVGLDPCPELIPNGVDLLSFSQQIIDATAEFTCAYKPNMAFYLSYGVEGMEALKGTIAHVPDDIPMILDAKFGDISYTAGYFKGMLMGQRGGAEYELLSGIPGKSFAYLQNALTIASVMIILMVGMNIRWYLQKGSEEVS